MYAYRKNLNRDVLREMENLCHQIEFLLGKSVLDDVYQTFDIWEDIRSILENINYLYSQIEEENTVLMRQYLHRIFECVDQNMYVTTKAFISLPPDEQKIIHNNTNIIKHGVDRLIVMIKEAVEKEKALYMGCVYASPEVFSGNKGYDNLISGSEEDEKYPYNHREFTQNTIVQKTGKICPNCNAFIPADDVECSKCGASYYLD